MKEVDKLSGIIGELRFKGPLQSKEVYENMLDILARNQPNQKWLLETEKMILGKCEANQDQQEILTKVTMKGKEVSLFCDGEVYNTRELKMECENLGYCTSGNSDEELILQGHLCFGERFLEKINGIFALVIYDGQYDSLFVACDRLGRIKCVFCLPQKSKGCLFMLK